MYCFLVCCRLFVLWLHLKFWWAWFRSSHQRCSVRKGVLRNFAKYTGKHLCQSLFFFEKKKRLGHRCFPGYPDNCFPRKIIPRLGLGFGSRSGSVLGLWATRQLLRRKITPWLGLGYGLGLVWGWVGDCPRTVFL